MAEEGHRIAIVGDLTTLDGRLCLGRHALRLREVEGAAVDYQAVWSQRRERRVLR